MPMKFESNCPCTGSSLEKLVQPALLAILAGKTCHGYGIKKKIGSLLYGETESPKAPSIYKALNFLETTELVTSSWDTDQKGPAKRLYAITPKGRACLETWATTLTRYSDTLARLLLLICKATTPKKKTCCCSPKPVVALAPKIQSPVKRRKEAIP